MKKLMAAGGLTGFGAGTLCGVLTEGATWPGILLRASVSALVAGLLLRWWAGVLARCLAQANAERQATHAEGKKTAAAVPASR